MQGEPEVEEPLLLPKDQIILLAQVLIAQSTGQMRDPQVVDYVFQSAAKLIESKSKDQTTPGTLRLAETNFSFREVSILVDAFYKTQLGLHGVQYGDLLLEHLESQSGSELTLDSLKKRPAKEVLKLFRGFATMDETVLSEQWRDKLFKVLESYIDGTEASSQDDDPMKIAPAMWLSIVEMCQRNNRFELS